jgi:HAD superfamily phosphoserine phosphatase-like hydrolase
METTPNAPLLVDLCGTLIAENTTNGFLDRWLKLSPSRRRVRSLLGGRRIVSVTALCGLSRQFLEQEAADYVRDRLNRFSNPVVTEAIYAAQSRGSKVYLATASLDCIANAVRKQLGMDGVVTARLGYDRHDRCTGFFSLDTTGRKLQHLRQLLSEEALHQATVYSDNREDLELLRVVSHPHYLGRRHDLIGLTDADAGRFRFLAPVMPKGGYATR